MYEEVECPYCKVYVEINPDEHYKKIQAYECPECEKNFEVLAETHISYSSCGMADCLNGGEHKWERIIRSPFIRFKGKYRCKDCSAEHTVKDEKATQAEWDLYYNRDIEGA